MSSSSVLEQLACASECSEQQACPSERSDMDALSPEPASKRTRIEIDSFDKLDLDKFTLKDNGKHAKGGKKVFPLIKNEVIRFNLTPVDWAQTPYGFALDCKFEKPSFLTGMKPEKPSEGLILKVNLTAPQIDFMKKLDNVAQTAWKEFASTSWQSLVTDPDKYGNIMGKITVILRGDELTKIAIVDKGKVTRGEGWEFLKEQGYVNGLSAFARADVKLTAKVLKLWQMGPSAGLKLVATQLVLRVNKKVEEDVFEDDEQLLK